MKRLCESHLPVILAYVCLVRAVFAVPDAVTLGDRVDALAIVARELVLTGSECVSLCGDVGTVTYVQDDWRLGR